MKYLAIDASTEACSVALSIDDQVTSRFELCPQSHSIVLLPMIDEVLRSANCKLSELDGIIFGQGPGSFTGVRIGIGVVQGLAFSADLPVVGVSTLRAMAQQAYQKYGEHTVIAAIDARMSEVYSGYFVADEDGIMQPQLAETNVVPARLNDYYQALTLPAYGVGTGWDAYENELSALRTNKAVIDILYPDAKGMLAIGIKAFQAGESVPAEEAQPVYVRDTVSWKKLPGRE